MIADEPLVQPRDGTRAIEPAEAGSVIRDGIRIAWERYGDGHPTILLMPTWSIIHSRHWKGQIAYLARHFRVVTFDGRGNGRSDRPLDPEAYRGEQFMDDAIAVLDASGTDRAVLAGLSMGSGYALRLAATYPHRVLGAVFIGPAIDLAVPRDPDDERKEEVPFDEPSDQDEGWAKYNEFYWRRDWEGFTTFFFGELYNEPHSTKQIEDAITWALETDPEVIIAAERVDYLEPPAWLEADPEQPAGLAFIPLVRCPCLVIHGSDDAIVRLAIGRRFAELLEAPLVILGGSGHAPNGRDPVKVNLLIRRFVETLAVDP
jgi:pimeloyl-ACP methyl ester carboxylesterase